MKNNRTIGIILVIFGIVITAWSGQLAFFFGTDHLAPLSSGRSLYYLYDAFTVEPFIMVQKIIIGGSLACACCLALFLASKRKGNYGLS